MPDLWLRWVFHFWLKLLIFSRLGKLEWEVSRMNYLSARMGIYGVFLVGRMGS